MDREQIQITTPEHVSLQFKVAGLGSRATAHLIDVLILVTISFALSFGIFYFLGQPTFAIFPILPGYIMASWIVVLFALWWGYFILFEFFSAGQTPGKILLGLRIFQDNGQTITFLSSLVRNLLRLIDLLPLFYLVGILSIFFHPKHKRVGDLAAGTLVVYDRSRRRKKADSLIAKEMERRGLDLNRIALDEWSKSKLGVKEWNLLKTYIERWPSLREAERNEMTMKVSHILFPLIGIECENKGPGELENDLFVLYLLLKEEWDFQ